MADEKTMTPDQLVAAYSAPAVSVNYMSASIVGEQMRIAFGETVQGSAPLFVRFACTMTLNDASSLRDLIDILIKRRQADQVSTTGLPN